VGVFGGLNNFGGWGVLGFKPLTMGWRFVRYNEFVVSGV